MFKNVAGKFVVFAFDATTNVPKTGDAAQLTAYVSKDDGTVTVLGDTSATEMDATNAPGYYLFDAAQAETNADKLLVSGKSSTSNIKVIGAPAVIYTRPSAFGLVAGAAGGVFIAGTNSATTVTTALTTTFTGNLTGSVASVTGLTASTVHADLDDIQARLPSALVSGRIDASIGAVAANAITAAAIADNAIDRATFAADTGLQSIRSNTAQAGGASTITLDAGASAVDSFYNSNAILTTGGTGAGQFRSILSYVGATKVATVDSAWATNPDSTTTFAIFPEGSSSADIATAVWAAVTRTLTAATNITSTGGTTVPQTGDSFARIGAAGASLTAVGLSAAAVQAIWDAATSALTTAGSIGKKLADWTILTSTTTADAVWNAVATSYNVALSMGNKLNAAGSAGDPWTTALPGAYGAGSAGKIVGDNINATVSSRATPAQVATELATYDAPTHTELTAELATADDAVLAAVAALNNLSQANVRTALGLASANLDTQLDALPTNVELSTALAAADDAILAAIAALQNLSQANVRTAVGLASANLDTQFAAIPSDKLTAHAAAVLKLVVGAGSTVTAVKFSTVEGAAPSGVNDFYNGAVIVFTSGVLAGQRTSISDYDGASTTATVVALTSAPVNTVTGVIV